MKANRLVYWMTQNVCDKPKVSFLNGLKIFVFEIILSLSICCKKYEIWKALKSSCGSGRTAFLTFLAVVKAGRKTCQNVSKITTYFLLQTRMTGSLAARAAWRMTKGLRTTTTRESPASRPETMTKPSCTIVFRALGNPEHVTHWSRCAGNVWRHYASPGPGTHSSLGTRAQLLSDGMITRERKKHGQLSSF